MHVNSYINSFNYRADKQETKLISKLPLLLKDIADSKHADNRSSTHIYMLHYI